MDIEAFAGAFHLAASNDKEKASKRVCSFLAMAIRSLDQLGHVPGCDASALLLHLAMLLLQLPCSFPRLQLPM